MLQNYAHTAVGWGLGRLGSRSNLLGPLRASLRHVLLHRLRERKPAPRKGLGFRGLGSRVSGLGLRVKGSGSRVQLPDRLQLRAPNAPFEHIMRSDDDLHTLVLSTAHHRAHPGSGSRG
eukprot:1796682-Rhodomonas_salina.2